jgi:asparagine synthase (glutamine-hydrolysing)
MCGIAGVFHLDGKNVSMPVLRRMTDVVQHRGPDGEGHWADRYIGFGHRRLKILDLSEAAHQPMLTPDQKHALTFNGEIYNFRELRTELEASGVTFRSAGDTEVVLQALTTWGIDAVKRFNGMFAFGYWDGLRQTLYLSRDRYGIKPLYYTFRNNTVVFASEIKSILEFPDTPRALNPHALQEYLTFQNIYSDITLFEGVHLLPAATWAEFHLGAQRIVQTTRYWDFHFRDEYPNADARELAAETNRLFTQAVERQLVADVQVGTYLSGGMDSGAITAVAAGHTERLATFTAGFDLTFASGMEIYCDERKRAEALSHQFRTEMYEVVLKAGDMEHVLPELSWHLEDPRVGQSYPNYYVARLASKFVKVVLGGTGGDEIFGGYPWRYYHAVHCKSYTDFEAKTLEMWCRLVPLKYMPHLYSATVSRTLDPHRPQQTLSEVLSGPGREMHTPDDYLNRLLYFEAKTFLPGLLLVQDKLSMAHSLEERVPFLDNDLVDFAMKLPIRSKLREIDRIRGMDENLPEAKSNYFQKTNDGKIILRQGLSHYLGDDYVQGIKQGFSAPDASWFRGESIDYVRRILLSADAHIYEYLNRSTVTELVQEHLDGKTNRRLLIWSLLSLEWWIRSFLR